MSEPTIIDAEDVERDATLEDRITELEGLVMGLLDGHKNILENFRKMVLTVIEISGESSEE